MFFRLLHLACGLMIVLLGVKVYAIAGDLMGDTDSASSALTAVAMAQSQPQTVAPVSVPPPVQSPKAVETAAPGAGVSPKVDDLCAKGGC